MIIERKYKFYAAHRNQHLVGSKCARLHGHRYGLDVAFVVERSESKHGGHVSVLFEDLDSYVDPIVQRLDHRTFCDENDSSLLEALMLLGGCRDHIMLPYPSSVENVCHFIFGQLNHRFPGASTYVKHIRLQETDSAVMVYNRQDWLNDHAKPISYFFPSLPQSPGHQV